MPATGSARWSTTTRRGTASARPGVPVGRRSRETAPGRGGRSRRSRLPGQRRGPDGGDPPGSGPGGDRGTARVGVHHPGRGAAVPARNPRRRLGHRHARRERDVVGATEATGTAWQPPSRGAPRTGAAHALAEHLLNRRGPVEVTRKDSDGKNLDRRGGHPGGPGKAGRAVGPVRRLGVGGPGPGRRDLPPLQRRVQLDRPAQLRRSAAVPARREPGHLPVLVAESGHRPHDLRAHGRPVPRHGRREDAGADHRGDGAEAARADPQAGHLRQEPPARPVPRRVPLGLPAGADSVRRHLRPGRRGAAAVHRPVRSREPGRDHHDARSVRVDPADPRGPRSLPGLHEADVHRPREGRHGVGQGRGDAAGRIRGEAARLLRPRLPEGRRRGPGRAGPQAAQAAR